MFKRGLMVISVIFIWIYDENGKVIDNGLTDEIEKDDKTVALLEEFKYIGFSSESDKQVLTEKVQRVYSSLGDFLACKYFFCISEKQ